MAAEAIVSPLRPRLHLEASGLSKRYGRRLLFRDLSLSLNDGRSLAIVGPNGSGKSTLLRILGGLLTPSSGKVELRVDGVPVPLTDHPLHVGIVAPYANLYGHLTAAENLHFVLRLRGAERPASTVREMLEEVGLGARAKEVVETYSSGMLQRLRLAAALISEPSVLLLDEPTSTLDADGNEMVRRIVARSTSEGRIVILATNIEAETSLCDAVCSVTQYT